jgi:hypothetical protein
LTRHQRNRFSLRAPRLCESHKRLQDSPGLISRRGAGNAEVFSFNPKTLCGLGALARDNRFLLSQRRKARKG